MRSAKATARDTVAQLAGLAAPPPAKLLLPVLLAAVIVALTGLVSGCTPAVISPLPGPECKLQQPKIKSISPLTGSAAGGTEVTIIGSCFTRQTEIRFGNATAHEVKIERTDKIVVTSPPGSGAVSIRITVKNTSGRRFAVISENQFRYQLPSGATSASAGATG